VSGAIRIRVGGVYVNASQEILLVRHEKKGHEYWLLPGGGCEFGEGLASALERELREEANVQTRTLRLLFINESIPSDAHRHVLNLSFLGELLGGEARLNEVSDRLKEVAWVGRERVDSLKFFPNFKAELLRHWDSGFSLPPSSLGNLWED
jgi:8-oxo-dGTP diphosphatase